MVLAELGTAFVRRKRFEARLIALEVVKALSEALGSGGQAAAPPASTHAGRYRGRYREVPAGRLLGRMGIRWG